MGYGLRKRSCTVLEEIHFHFQWQTLDSKVFTQIGPTDHFDRCYLSFVKLRYSGALQEDRERDNCQEVRVESSQSRAWTAMLEAPLWTAPWCQPLTPPTTGCAGRPLPLRTSCLVLAGRSPGLEEPPLYNRFPSLSLPFCPFFHSASVSLPLSHVISLFPAVTLCLDHHFSPSFAHFLNVSIFLFFIPFLFLFPPTFLL